jgi:hypothetical protein
VVVTSVVVVDARVDTVVDSINSLVVVVDNTSVVVGARMA